MGRRIIGHHDRCESCQATYDAKVAAELAHKEAQHAAALREYKATLGQLRLGVDLRVALPLISAAAERTSLTAPRWRR